MKKLTALLSAAVLCISFTACGGTGNPDHDYVLALMEKGDYAMAITVLENLYAQSADAAQQAPTSEEKAPRPQAEQTPASTLTDIQQLTVNTVKQFMEAKGNAMIQAFESVTASPAREPSVVDAAEYRLGNIDGNGSNAHCLLIALDADIAVEDGLYDSLQLLLDMDTMEIYCSAETDWELLESGNPSNNHEFNWFLLNSYSCNRLYGNDVLWADAEFLEPLTADDIGAVNRALKAE